MLLCNIEKRTTVDPKLFVYVYFTNKCLKMLVKVWFCVIIYITNIAVLGLNMLDIYIKKQENIITYWNFMLHMRWLTVKKP